MAAPKPLAESRSRALPPAGEPLPGGGALRPPLEPLTLSHAQQPPVTSSSGAKAVAAAIRAEGEPEHGSMGPVSPPPGARISTEGAGFHAAAGVKRPKRPLGSDKFKTELCANWRAGRPCVYGIDCLYAHGEHELRPRLRISTYKTHPCCDCVYDRGCNYEGRCNYVHPGSPLRCAFSNGSYTDRDYQAFVDAHHAGEDMPFGVFI